MAGAEEALFAILSGDDGVKAIVGDRIYPLMTPEEGKYPAISFFRIDGPREHALDGPAGLARPRMQVDVWANDYRTARNAIEAVIAALDGYRGTAAGVFIAGILAQNDHDIFEGRTRTYHCAADFQIMYGT